MTGPHEVLGVRVGASSAQVRRAYRSYVALHHPDRGGDPDRFLAGQEAYRQLVAGSADGSDVVVRFHRRRSVLGTVGRKASAVARRIARRPIPPPRVQ